MVSMVPVNAVTAISLSARSEDQAIKLAAPCTLVVDVELHTEDGRPVPFEAAAEGLIVSLAFPGGKRSKAIRLEASPDKQSSDGRSFAFVSGELQTAGTPQHCHPQKEAHPPYGDAFGMLAMLSTRSNFGREEAPCH